MRSAEHIVAITLRHAVWSRVQDALSPFATTQLDKTLLGTGLIFRAQLLDFFPDPYQDDTDWLKELRNETPD